MPWCLKSEQLKSLMAEWLFSQTTKEIFVLFVSFTSRNRTSLRAHAEMGPSSEPMQQDTNLTGLAFPGMVWYIEVEFNCPLGQWHATHRINHHQSQSHAVLLCMQMHIPTHVCPPVSHSWPQK